MDEFKERVAAASATPPPLVYRIGDIIEPGSFETVTKPVRWQEHEVLQTHGDPSRWYVTRTNPKLEDKAADGLRGVGLMAYAPKLRVWRGVKRPKAGNDKKRVVELPLFVGYVFVGFPRGRSEDFGVARGVDGVHSFVGVQGAPIAIPLHVIQAIQDEEATGLYDETRAKPAKFAHGQTVVVSKGPFAGMRGHVSQISAGERVKVLLAFLGSVSAVTLGMDHVELSLSA